MRPNPDEPDTGESAHGHGEDPGREFPCPECAYPRLTLISDGDVVSVLKCSRCGHLAAPVKEA